MEIKLINIGFGNIVAAHRIVTIIGPESAPIKRIIQEGKDKGMVIDATYGRRTRAVLVMDSGHARKVALERAQILQVPVVLGSATPDLESYYKAINGEYCYLKLTKRPTAGGQLPKVEIVDMRAELQSGNKSVLSRSLRSALVETANVGEQAIVLLNRRGFSTFVMCRDCGETITCPNCAVALVYHAKEKLMRCHYCGHTMSIPDECPKCHSRRIKFFGTGTERAEGELQSLAENIKPIRMIMVIVYVFHLR